MITKTSGYQTPRADVIEIQHGGILCSSTPFGTATTDNFVFGENISGNF